MMKRTLSTLASLLVFVASVGLTTQAANEGHHLSVHAAQALTDPGSDSQIRNLDPPCWSCTHAPRQDLILDLNFDSIFVIPNRVQGVVLQADRAFDSPHLHFSARGPPRPIT